MKGIKVDIPFLLSICVLVIAGFLIFSSASLGLISSQGGKYSSVTFSQIFFGLFLGVIFCFITSQINYKFYRKYSFYLFLASIAATLLVFVPGLGVEHGCAHRWIYLGTLSFQTSELLKIGFIIYLSAWLSGAREGVKTFTGGFLPFFILSSIIGVILLLQPDTDTFMIAIFSGLAIYLTAGGRWKHILIFVLIGLIGFGALAYSRPYVRSRIMTFIHPVENDLGSGYQIKQSLIAIGSGGLGGRGFGQSIQKFDNHLPEPIGDSIFAVAGEEFGFVGSVSIIILFVFFAFRGLKIASQIQDSFGRLMVVGIVIMVVSQAFVNISAMVGVIPLSGITLPFISHGGTSLFMTLIEMGVVLNISKYKKNK
jgi:cell division protein FtsW